MEGLVAATRPSLLRPAAYFVAWSGVLTLAYDGVSPQLEALKAALDKVGVKNELFTVPGGKHGGFSAPENVAVYGAIKKFLKAQGLPVQ